MLEVKTQPNQELLIDQLKQITSEAKAIFEEFAHKFHGVGARMALRDFDTRYEKKIAKSDLSSSSIDDFRALTRINLAHKMGLALMGSSHANKPDQIDAIFNSDSCINFRLSLNKFFADQAEPELANRPKVTAENVSSLFKLCYNPYQALGKSAEQLNYNQGFTSFDPKERHILLNYLGLPFMQRKIQQHVENLQARFGNKFDESIDSVALFNAIQHEAKSLLPIGFHKSTKTACRNEIVAQLYIAYMRSSELPDRSIEISLNPRDQFQSVTGNAVPAIDMLRVIDSALELAESLPAIRYIQSFGGGVPEACMMPNLHGDQITQPFNFQKKVFELQRDRFYSHLLPNGENIYDISEGDLGKIAVRFSFDEARDAISPAELHKILNSNESLTNQKQLIDKLCTLYALRFSMLYRGENGTALYALTDFYLKDDAKWCAKYGIGKAEVFDAYNRDSAITRGGNSFAGLDVEIAPAVHLSPTNPFMVQQGGYLRLSSSLLRKFPGMLYLKDAPNQEPFNTIGNINRTFGRNHTDTKIEQHQHDSDGLGIIKSIEKVRVAGDATTVLDLSEGLGGFLAQPELLKLLKAFKNTKWSLSNSSEVEDKVIKIGINSADIIRKHKEPIKLSAEMRLLCAKNGVPGGAFESTLRIVNETFGKGAIKKIFGSLGHSTHNIYDENGKLTEDGIKCQEALYRYLIETIGEQIKLFSNIQSVTPSYLNMSQQEVRMLVEGLKIKGAERKLHLEFVSGNYFIKYNQNSSAIDCITSLVPGLANILIQYAQDSKSTSADKAPTLRDMYPDINPSLVTLAFTQEIDSMLRTASELGKVTLSKLRKDICDAILSEDGINDQSVRKVLSAAYPIAKSLGRAKFVDLVAFKAYLGLIANPDEASAETLRSEAIGRLSNVGEKLSVASSYGEIQKIYAEQIKIIEATTKEAKIYQFKHENDPSVESWQMQLHLFGKYFGNYKNYHVQLCKLYKLFLVSFGDEKKVLKNILHDLNVRTDKKAQKFAYEHLGLLPKNLQIM